MIFTIFFLSFCKINALGGGVLFTYCPAEAIEAAEAGRIPPVFDDVAPPRPIRLRVDCCCRELLAKVGDG